MDISNKTLAWLLVGAIVVSLIGTFTSINRLQRISISGAATSSDTGNATVYINTTASLIFSVATVDWGTGYVNTTAGEHNCTMMTDGTANSDGCVGFNTVTQGLVIENNGNKNFSTVQLKSDENASGFIGGGDAADAPSPEFQWKISQNETGSCGTIHDTTWTDVNTTNPGTVICNNFHFEDTNDSIRVDLRIVIPYDAAGDKIATLTATGTV